MRFFKKHLLFKVATLSLFLQIGGAGIAFLLQVIFARLLGVQDFGNYIYVLTWINILVLIAKFGLDTLLLRYVSAYEGKQEWRYLRGVIVWSFQITFLLSIIVSGLLILFIWELSYYIEIKLAKLFLIGSFLILPLTFARLAQSILRGLQHVILPQTIELVLRPVILGAIILILYIAEISLSVFLVLTVTLISTVLIFILSIVITIHYLPNAVKMVRPLTNSLEWRITVFPLFILSGTLLIMNQTDTVMLGILQGTQEAGIYASVARITEFIMFGLTAFNALAAPMISNLYTLNNKKELQYLITKVAWGSFLFSIVASIFLIIEGKLVLSFFGEEFVAGYSSLVILLIGQTINALAGSVGFMMTMTGNQTIAAKIFAVSALLNVILNLVLIPFFGMIGAAIATSFTTAFWNIALFWFVWKHIGINSTIFFTTHE